VLILNLGLLAFAFGLEDSPDAPGLWTAIRRRLRGLAATVPAAVLLVRFQLDQRPTTSGTGPGWQERARYLTNLYDIISYDRVEVWIAGAFALALGAALVWVAFIRVRERGWRWQDMLLVSAVAVAALYFTAPQVSIPGVRSEPIHYRFSLHVLLAFLLWLAAELRSRPGRLLVGASLLAALGLTAVRFPYYARFDDLLAEQTSVAPFIPRGATFLALSFDHEGDGGAARPLPPAWVMGPLRHAADRLAVSRDLLAMDNYQADTRHFPLRFRAGANPHELLQTRLDGMPGCVRIGRFNRRAPRPIEYILIWRREHAPSDPCTRSTLRYVETHYRRVYVSARRGFGEVFQRRQPSGP
jgi:uncharacterized membrane protein